MLLLDHGRTKCSDCKVDAGSVGLPEPKGCHVLHVTLTRQFWKLALCNTLQPMETLAKVAIFFFSTYVQCWFRLRLVRTQGGTRVKFQRLRAATGFGQRNFGAKVLSALVVCAVEPTATRPPNAFITHFRKIAIKWGMQGVPKTLR